jgi:hypothetical protein
LVKNGRYRNVTRERNGKRATRPLDSDQFPANLPTHLSEVPNVADRDRQKAFIFEAVLRYLETCLASTSR